MTAEADWDNLPKLVAFSVLDKLYEAIDRINFGVVSTKWHIIAKEHRLVHQNHKKELPMLMVPATNNHNKRRLYSILEGKIYPIHLSVPNEICIGSCYSWLAFANHKTFVIKLVNPFKKVNPIKLPPIEFEHVDLLGSKFKIKKVILSADPLVSPNNYVVVTIYGGDGQLAFLKSGQNKWGKICLENWICFTDVILYKDIFYAVTIFSTLISFKLSSTDDYNKVDQVNILDETYSSSVPRVYLVESSKGDLLMVHRSFVDNEVEQGKVRITKSIKVYKLVLDTTSGALIESVETTSLDDDAVFVGFNYSWSVSALDFPKCSPNSIYFTNDFFQLYNNMDGPCDLGVYNMKEESFGEHHQIKASYYQFKPPVWVFPPV